MGLTFKSRRCRKHFKVTFCAYCGGSGWTPVKRVDGSREFEPCDYCGGTGLE